MDHHTDTEPATCHRDHPGRDLIRWFSNANPFYAISAVLVLIGLRMSFNPDVHAFPAWVFILGLAAYTMLMAGMACVLVRLGNVWEDVRTLLLLVVIVFVGIAMIFDEVLMRDRQLGRLCDLGAAVFAIALSETTLRGMRLRLPALYRIPFYLGLALLFLYPVPLVPLLDRPGNLRLSWALFGFSPAAGLIALTLLPAIRRGPSYVAKTGTPWRWPLYPWALFVILGLGLVARALSLCWSMQAPAFPELRQSLFRPYFLVPLGLSVSILILELGLVTRSRAAVRFGLSMPVGLLILAMLGHGTGPFSVSGRFLDAFTTRLGGTPTYLTLLATIVFYAVASIRRIPSSSVWLTLGLVALAFIGPETLTLAEPSAPRPVPLWAASVFQAVLALRSPNSGRWMVVSVLASVAVSVSPMPPVSGLPTGPILGLHLAIAAALVIGSTFHDGLAKFLQVAGLAALTLASLSALTMVPNAGSGLERALLRAYPLFSASLAIAYAYGMTYRPALVSAALSFGGWLSVVGRRGYAELRPSVAGLDQISLGLAFFALAALISLAKAGVLARWLITIREWARQPPV